MFCFKIDWEVPDYRFSNLKYFPSFESASHSLAFNEKAGDLHILTIKKRRKENGDVQVIVGESGIRYCSGIQVRPEDLILTGSPHPGRNGVEVKLTAARALTLKSVRRGSLRA